MTTPVLITFEAIAAVTGAASGVPGVQTLTFYDYNTELAAIDAELKAIGVSLAGMATAIGVISGELTKILEFLVAVQSPTGDFRTISPEDTPNTVMVSTALSSNVPPIVVTPEATT